MRKGIIILICFLLSTSIWAQTDKTWQEAQSSKQATLNIYWFDSRPFIYPSGDTIAGIEYDLITDFVDFVTDQYKVEKSLGVKVSKTVIGFSADFKNLNKTNNLNTSH